MGIPGLDRMVAGGVNRGSTTLISGASGTGKTIIALHFAYAGLIQGEAVTFVTFEENPPRIVYTGAQLHIDLNSYQRSGRLHFLHVSPMELDVDEHIFQIQKLVKDTGSKRLIIDSISAFEIGMRDKVKYTDYIWALTDYFKMQGISVLITHEMHNSAQTSELTKYGISFVADNLILLQFVEDGIDVKRFIRVVKMRSSSHLTSLHKLQIDDSGVTVTDNCR
jgi:circadian clock protein KaiC